ncbi:hypothetical protein NRIC_03970 [Enterococcus florum]|uniref:Uncharacterized protein n=1 Tax=Enterococcus florum TaxID=2480627 RepID=A0A4P5P4Z4_9ENTE|nr:hypothetical protein [Enterococcus florum]GCF92506.1 hypothetical protein NRIC_03970 [Enterococcus florum]
MFRKKCNNYYPSRKYLQINDLVIDNYEMLQDADLSGGFKVATHEYSFGHGSYSPSRKRQQFSTEQRLSLSIKVNYRKFEREQRKFFKDWVMMNISQSGRVWAIEGNQLLWAFAKVENFSEPYSVERFSLEMDIDLVLYEGIWHKADVRKTFLKPYLACNFLECLDFQEVDECLDCCVGCLQPANDLCTKCMCKCESLDAESSLCEMKWNISQVFNENCEDSYQIIYNCEAGKKIWGEKMLGHKLCKEEACKNLIAGQFYSDTVLETDQVEIILDGNVEDLVIEINGNRMRIKGTYDGKLKLQSSGDIYYQSSECCNWELVDMNNLVIPNGHTFGFFVRHGMNSVVIETNNCCDMTCVYIKVDSITI